MAAAEAALAGMDPSDTPGTRASVDRCEIKATLGGGYGRFRTGSTTRQSHG